jgi:hypothetical protein
MFFTKEQLLPGENLVILARQHPLVLFRPVLLSIAALAVFSVLSYFSKRIWLMALFIIPLIYLLREPFLKSCD